ncbi:MAG: bifunctional 2-methylcitrate synthase/citrate synthase [Pseudomonadota bacterium]
MTDTATPTIHKGLFGVTVDETAISKVMAETNSLTYRGYPVEELCEHASFEEVAYLMWYGELPNSEQLARFTDAERGLRGLTRDQVALLDTFADDAHPMDVLRAGIAALGAEKNRGFADAEQAQRDHAMSLLGKIPTFVAADHRRRKGLSAVSPRADLGFSENFLYMMTGEVPSPEVSKAFDVSMILYAEHGFNASTFTCRVIASTLSDLNSAITGGIGALKGPIHGGANEAVMYMLLDMDGPSSGKAWVEEALASKKKIMGFGHRVYRSGDSRVPTMRTYLRGLAMINNRMDLIETMDAVEDAMFNAKSIHPNVDFITGPAYYLMGIEIDFYTPLFVMSRITGWCAHYFEQISSNRLIRPLAAYTGAAQRRVKPLGLR